MKVPRELLWAIIAALLIAVFAIWPSQYPYKDAPQVIAQKQSANSVGGDKATEHEPSPQKNTASNAQDEHGSQHAPEITFLGIKPGEWLLGIVTWMLWLATVGLVRGAEKTSEAQLRPYVHIAAADLIWSGEFRVVVHCKNSGQTPATFFEIGCISFATDRYREEFVPNDLQYGAWASLGGGETKTVRVTDGVSAEHARWVLASNEKERFILAGRVRYGDVFGNEYETEFVYFTPIVTPNTTIKMSRARGRFKTYHKTKSGQGDD